MVYHLWGKEMTCDLWGWGEATHVLSPVWLHVTLWTVARQAPLSMEFSRQEYWSGLPLPPPGDLPQPGTEPLSLAPHALTVGFFTTSATEKPHCDFHVLFYFVLITCTHTHTHTHTPNHTISPEWGEKRQAFLEDQLGNSQQFQELSLPLPPVSVIHLYSKWGSFKIAPFSGLNVKRFTLQVWVD